MKGKHKEKNDVISNIIVRRGGRNCIVIYIYIYISISFSLVNIEIAVGFVVIVFNQKKY
jgi:hypothetical protein